MIAFFPPPSSRATTPSALPARAARGLTSRPGIPRHALPSQPSLRPAPNRFFRSLPWFVLGVGLLVGVWSAGGLAQTGGTEETKAQLLIDSGNPQAAVDACTKALQKSPHNTTLLRQRGLALTHLKKYAEAIADFDAALKRNPKDAQAYNQRGNARKAAGDPKAALTDYDRAIAADPRYVAAYVNRGTLRREAGDLRGAQKDYDRALELEPQRESALLNRAILKSKLRDTAGEMADLDRVLVLNPKNTIALNNRGSLLLQQGNPAAAQESFSRTLAIDPQNGFAYANRGLARVKQGDTAGARADFEQALKLNPKDEVTQKHLATLPAQAVPPAPPAATAATAQEGFPSPTAAPRKPALPTTNSRTKNAPTQVARVTPVPLPVESAPPRAPTDKAPPPKVRPSLNPPPPPSPPKPVESKSPASRRMSGFKLVKSECPEQGAYTNQSPSGGLHRDLGGGSSVSLSWNVPEVILSGVPAAFQIECKANENTSQGCIYLDSSGEGKLGGVLVAARTGDYWGRLAPAPADHFAFVLPDLPRDPGLLAPDQLNQKLSFRMRDRELERIAENGGDGGVTNLKTPNQVPVAVIEHRLKDWLTAESKFKEYGDLKVTVTQYSRSAHHSDLVIFTYHWTPDCGPVMEDAQDLADHLEIVPSPAGRQELRADGHDGLWLMARLLPKLGEPGPTLQEAVEGITFSAVGGDAGWLDFSAPVLRNGWKLIYVQASNPDPARGPRKPPAALVVQAVAPAKNGGISRQLTLRVPPEAEMDAKPDFVEFAAQSGRSSSVKVRIENPGKEPWKFRTEYAPDDRPLAKVELDPSGGDTAEITLREAGLVPKPNGLSREVSVLRIIAEQKNREPVERDIKVCIGQEGVFVDATGRDPVENCYRVWADGSGRKAEVDFRVFMIDPATRKAVNQKAVLGKLVIECLEPEGSVAAQAVKTGQLTGAFAGLRPSNDPAGIYKFACAKEVPGDGRLIKADFRVSYLGRDEDAFTGIFTIGIVTTSNGPGSADWNLELRRCQEIIDKFVPATYQPRLNAVLDRYKMTLGAEGLCALRGRIWRTAVELTLGEGGQGYANEAAWAGAITETLEWSQWAGDMAFSASIGTIAGPYGSFGAGVLKSSVISAINAYQDGRGVDEWLWENLCTVPGMIEGQIVDPSAFEKLGVESKARVWALFVSYHFCKNLYHGESVVGALKNAGQEAGNTILSTWLAGQVGKSTAQAGKTPAAKKAETNKKDGPDRKPAEVEEGTPAIGTAAPAAEAHAVQQVRRRMATRGGRVYAHTEDVLTIMRDPSMVRALKNAPPEIQNAFSNTRESLYRQHDAAVAQYVKDTVPDMQYRMVKVMEFRTPGQTGASLNTDRDYRVCYYGGRDPHTGKQQWIEVDRRHWENKSYETFAQVTGGPCDTPEQARHWAHQHQQLATDKAHAEASPDFSDQAKVWNPQTRKVESVQIVSPIQRVRAGQPGVSLKDPAALGQMYQMKVADARFKHEAFVQAQKAVKDLDAVRQGYMEQARKVGKLPESVRQGMEAVLEANRKLAADPNRRDPAAIAEAEKALRANGFSSLNDFMNKLGGQFESLKTM